MIAGEQATRWRRGERARNSGRPAARSRRRDRIASSGRADRASSRSSTHHAMPLNGPSGRHAGWRCAGVGRSTGSKTAVANAARHRAPRRGRAHGCRGDHEIVAGEQGAEAAVVVLAVGKVEVAQHGDLVHRCPAGRLGRDRRDPRRIGMRPGDLDPHARLRERGTVDGPADGGHLVPALRRVAREDAKGATSPVVPTVASAMRISQSAAMLRGAIRGPRRGAVIPPDLEEALHPTALAAVRLEQLEHPLVVCRAARRPAPRPPSSACGSRRRSPRRDRRRPCARPRRRSTHRRRPAIAVGRRLGGRRRGIQPGGALGRRAG